MKTDQMSRTIRSSIFCAVVVFISACGGSFQTGGDVARGRQALFRGDNQGALGYFQNAAQTDPGYVFGTDVQEGVFSYLGRAQYLNGQYVQARSSLERDLSQRSGDNLARLYLGLTLARQGDRQSGLRDIQRGMEGIRDYLNDVTANANDYRRAMDPYHDIRNAIGRDLAAISSGKINWDTFLVSGEKIALAWEQEPDYAREFGMQTRPYNLN
jgi:tetratricopeptide (TPR) repeat protein